MNDIILPMTISLNSSDFIAEHYHNLNSLGLELNTRYRNANPFPHIVLDNFFRDDFLDSVLAEFPDLSEKINRDKVRAFNNQSEIKLASLQGDSLFGAKTKALTWFLNSHTFIAFLQTLTGIKEPLIPDPHFVGGGYHEIKSGGKLSIHADFNKHPENGLDRRINLLIYLNKDWTEDYGGHFELWNKEMSHCVKKELPLFNRLVIFSTNDFSFHGHPDPLTCPENRSRRSLALYYYSNGRPSFELTDQGEHSTLFRPRPHESFEPVEALHSYSFRKVVKALLPPVVLTGFRKVRESFAG